MPLFTWLRSRRVPKGKSKIEDLLRHPFGNAWQPKDITHAVLYRIVRDKPMHVVDACELQDKLHRRYNSRCDYVSRWEMFGMIQADRECKCGERFIVNHAFNRDHHKNAIIERENAIKRLGKKKAKELELNEEMRVLFYLMNELKGLLNETRVW